MSKLLKLKEWLTVEETAKQLSIAAGEDVTEADILRLALDGHLTLSVYLVNHARARMGKVVPLSETEWTFLPPLLSITPPPLTEEMVEHYPENFRKLWKDTPPEQRSLGVPMLKSLAIDENRFINLEKDVTTLTGVWDLPLIGSERIDVEYTYQQLIGGPEVTLEGIDGSFVSRGSDVICQLQESWDENPYQRGSLAALERLKATLAEKEVPSEKANELLAKHKEDRAEFLANQASRQNADKYYPAGGVPKDSIYVVRTTALRALEERLLADEAQPEKPLHPSERRSAGQIITTLAAMAGLDLSAPYAADETLRAAAATLGLELPSSPETVVKFLKDAAARADKA